MTQALQKIDRRMDIQILFLDDDVLRGIDARTSVVVVGPETARCSLTSARCVFFPTPSQVIVSARSSPAERLECYHVPGSGTKQSRSARLCNNTSWRAALSRAFGLMPALESLSVTCCLFSPPTTCCFGSVIRSGGRNGD